LVNIARQSGIQGQGPPPWLMKKVGIRVIARSPSLGLPLELAQAAGPGKSAPTPAIGARAHSRRGRRPQRALVPAAAFGLACKPPAPPP
jgi:hypothetical protein